MNDRFVARETRGSGARNLAEVADDERERHSADAEVVESMKIRREASSEELDRGGRAELDFLKRARRMDANRREYEWLGTAEAVKAQSSESGDLPLRLSYLCGVVS